MMQIPLNDAEEAIYQLLKQIEKMKTQIENLIEENKRLTQEHN